VKVEVTVMGSPVPIRPYGFYGHKAALNLNNFSELRSCVKVNVDVLGSPSPIVRSLYGRKAALDVKWLCCTAKGSAVKISAYMEQCIVCKVATVPRVDSYGVGNTEMDRTAARVGQAIKQRERNPC